MTPNAPLDNPAALTTFIEARFHQSHREQLPNLMALAQKVERVHSDHPEVPGGLAVLLQRMADALEMHMKREEMLLFPAIRRGGGHDLAQPIAVMRADHDDHMAEVLQIRTLTGDLALPDGACRSWTSLYDGLRTFLNDLETHIRLEDDVLFPQVASAD